jgi:hypothetical protein
LGTGAYYDIVSVATQDVQGTDYWTTVGSFIKFNHTKQIKFLHVQLFFMRGYVSNYLSVDCIKEDDQ